MFHDQIFLALLSAQMDAVLSHLRYVSFEIGRGNQGEAELRLTEAYYAAVHVGRLEPRFDRAQRKVVIEGFANGPVDVPVTDDDLFTKVARIQSALQKIADRLDNGLDMPTPLKQKMLLLLNAMQPLLSSSLESPKMVDDTVDMSVLDPTHERYKVPCYC